MKKTYQVTLNLVGTENPSVGVFHNGFGTATWLYDSVGKIYLTAEGQFVNPDRVWKNIPDYMAISTSDREDSFLKLSIVNSDKMLLEIFDADLNPVDITAYGIPILIETQS